MASRYDAVPGMLFLVTLWFDLRILEPKLRKMPLELVHLFKRYTFRKLLEAMLETIATKIHAKK